MLTKSRAHLAALQTPFGLRSVYDAVCYCNRCGMCASVCPSYLRTKQEPFSPRGRNQTLRLALGGKINLKKEHKLVKEMVRSCELCGRCVQHCPGKIPTPQLVLELRRRQNIKLLPATLCYLVRFRQTVPQLFGVLIKGASWLRWTGVLHVLSWLPGFTWVNHALKIWPHNTKISRGPSEKDPTLIYLPSLEAQYLMPTLFEQTYQLAATRHRVSVWNDTASGLFEYVYGDLRRARKIVRQLIHKHAAVGNGEIPVLTDSIDVYNYLIQIPQLFAGLSSLEKKATHFAKCVRYVTDILPENISLENRFPLPVQLLNGAAFSQETAPQLKAQKILCTLFGKNFVQCGYKEGIVPSLGYGFVTHGFAPAYTVSAVQLMAAHTTQSVFVLSGLVALEVEYCLRREHSRAQVRHIVELKG